MWGIKSAVKNPLIIGTTCFLAYAASYMGRNILSAMLPLMIENNIYNRDLLAAMGSSFFITYGSGQLINGFIGNKVSSKYMVFVGLFATGLLSMIFPLLNSQSLSYLLWGACGFLCSMLWGPLSKLVGENTSAAVGRLILTLLTIASVVGTGVTYLLAILSTLRGSWKLGFFVTGIVLVILSVHWFLSYSSMEKKHIIKYKGDSNKSLLQSNTTIKQLLEHGFISITIVTMLNGVIRNAVGFWIPAYISERFQVSSASATAIASILPFVNLGGTLLSVYISKYFKYNEKKTLTLLFSISTIMFAGMYFSDGRGMVLNIVALFAASAAMTGACNMIFSFYVLRFADSGKLSGITGFLDFSSYLSASVVSILFSSLISNFGWNFIVGIWALTMLLGVVFSLLSIRNDPLKPQVQLTTNVK